MTIEDVRRRHEAVQPTACCLCGLPHCQECRRHEEFNVHAHGDIAFLLRTLDAIAAKTRPYVYPNQGGSAVIDEVHALATRGKE